MKNKLFALVGPHACGKTSIIRQLVKHGVHYIPIYTTRSPESYANNPIEAATMYRFVEKDEFQKQDFLVKMTYKGEYYDKQNKLFKTMECQDIVQIDGYWTTQKMIMTTLSTSHKTIYEIKDIQYDNDINPAFFTVSALEREQVK